ncbi:MAG TPA: fused response regulator/phosphatase [Caulobacteraceae bacterium]|nr:fused response regulator/phosphatase [Caulobacteraceae bacterium]
MASLETGAANEAEGLRRPAPALDLGWARALVVDDVEENRDLLVRRLRRLGVWDVVQAANGREALERLGERNFDLVLLDIMMPEMNGYEVLDVLSADGRTHDLPVLVISALSEIDAVARCLEQGAEDFIFKPFNPIILRARVLASLEKKQLRDAARRELERKRAELNEARNLQLALAPAAAERDTPLGRISVEVMLEPAREVGGDLVDHFEVGERLHAVLVGDVSDKGAGAALVMARTHSQFRALSVRPDAEALFSDPARAASAVNEALAANNPSCMFVTLLLGVLDVESGELAYVRCGHVPPWILRADGGLDRLPLAGGPPLGLMEGASYRSGRAQLAPGETLLVVTDGVTEGSAPDQELFGEDRAGDWLKAAGSAATLPDLVALVRAHEAGQPASDDLAAVLLRIGAP